MTDSLFCADISVFPASLPVTTALQSRIAELSDELRQQGPALAAAQKKKARLEEVEADLGRTIQSLRSELTALQQKHSDELLAVSTANDGLRAERDDAVAAQAAMPVVTALQSRIAELSDELRHQGPVLAAAQKEKARLE